jgi:hypothetical protein
MSVPSTPRNQIARAPVEPPALLRRSQAVDTLNSSHQKPFLAAIAANSNYDRSFNREVCAIMQPMFQPKAVETPPPKPRFRHPTPFCSGF